MMPEIMWGLICILIGLAAYIAIDWMWRIWERLQ
jgi:hypothetical protein